MSNYEQTPEVLEQKNEELASSITEPFTAFINGLQFIEGTTGSIEIKAYASGLRTPIEILATGQTKQEISVNFERHLQQKVEALPERGYEITEIRAEFVFTKDGIEHHGGQRDLL